MGGLSKFDERCEILVFKWEKSLQYFDSKIKRELRLGLETRRTHQILRNHEYTEYFKQIESPLLSKNHKKYSI